jgi:tRNA(Ile)-lysidine synthase TilS/MesJ
MEHIKRLLSYTRRALADYDMIRPGDKIAVGVSAGKDSLTLLCALAHLRRFYPVPFEVVAVTVDMGFAGGMDFSGIQKLCDELEVEYHIVPTDIYKVIFEIRKESNPCALCAKMRRGALNNYAKSIGCTTVALGHHFDDVVDTFMLNLFFEGRIGCFQPVTYLSRQDLYVIRPMVYMPEKDIRYFATHNALPVVKSACPANGNTEREEMKQLLNSLDRKYPGLRYRIFGAMQRGEIDRFHLPRDGRMPAGKDYATDESGV